MDTKKLRQKILDLAIHGRLVPQDPADEPASELLKRIRAEKEQMVKAGKAKVFKTIKSGNQPFTLPKSWEWCTVGELAPSLQYGTAEKSSSSGKVAVLRMGNITRKGEINFDDLVYSSNDNDIEKLSLKPGDLLFNRTNSSEWVGKCAIYRGEIPAIYAGYIIKMTPIGLNTEYVNLVMISEYERDWCNQVKTDGINQSNINSQKLASFFLPIPPLAEQQRIVAKVEELFAQIDIIEQSETALEEAKAKAHSKILDLAIHGKLVPQAPNDEPASELLKRIRAEKQQMVKDGKLKKKDLDVKPITADEVPFEKPNGWEWARVIAVSLDSADGPFGSNLKREHYTTNKEVRIIQLSNIGEVGWRDENVKYTTFEHLPNIQRSEVFPGDIVVAKMMPAGRAIICPNQDPKYVLSSDAVRFTFPNCLYNKYLYYAINSRVFLDQVYEDVSGVTRVRTSLQKLRTYLLPLPPLAEQKRIVAKIEELFELLK